MKTLIVEDDFTCRLLLQSFLSPLSECHIAINGREALAAFQQALADAQPYDLICLDIMMPEMDGQAALRGIRAMEEGRGIVSSEGVKIVMTTAQTDMKSLTASFHGLCDDYLIKPIEKAKLLELVSKYGLAPMIDSH